MCYLSRLRCDIKKSVIKEFEKEKILNYKYI